MKLSTRVDRKKPEKVFIRVCAAEGKIFWNRVKPMRIVEMYDATFIVLTDGKRYRVHKDRYGNSHRPISKKAAIKRARLHLLAIKGSNAVSELMEGME